MKELPDDFIDALVAEPEKKKHLPIIKQPVGKVLDLVCVCGSKLEMGYCPNPECEWDAPEEVFDCEWCGCCPNPKHCVWSVQCPVCKSEAKKQCVERTKLVGLHQERWDASGSKY